MALCKKSVKSIIYSGDAKFFADHLTTVITLNPVFGTTSCGAKIQTLYYTRFEAFSWAGDTQSWSLIIH